MYASHDGVQQLVGVAGNATYLGEKAEAERRDLARELGLEERWKEAAFHSSPP